MRRRVIVVCPGAFAVALIIAACTADRTTAPGVTPAGLSLRMAESETVPLLSVTGEFGSKRDGPPPTFSDNIPSPWVVQHFAIVAKMSAGGEVSGHVHSLTIFPQSDSRSSWTEDVICLMVDGNVAQIGTVVVSTSPGTEPSVFVGKHYVYKVIDDGKDDRAQRGPNLTDCTQSPFPFPLNDATQGEVRIFDRR